MCYQYLLNTDRDAFLWVVNHHNAEFAQSRGYQLPNKVRDVSANKYSSESPMGKKLHRNGHEDSINVEFYFLKEWSRLLKPSKE